MAIGVSSSPNDFSWYNPEKCIYFGLIGFFINAILGWLLEPLLVYSDNTLKDEDDSKIIRMDGSSNRPSISDKSSLDLTIVIPAYNEEVRLPVMLDALFDFLPKWSKKNKVSYEVLVVDDGSKDGTNNLVRGYINKYPKCMRMLSLDRNVGKGGAVKRGMMISRGKYMLMVDADGATDISDLDSLYHELLITETIGIAIGSRAHLSKNSVATRAWHRTILMYGFHALVRIFCSAKVKDTQCGFKLFSRDAAKVVFASLHLERWAFDVELIYVAESLKIPIIELPVHWHEVDGSKLIQSKIDIITTSLTMARDMFCVRLAYLLGIWKVKYMD